MKRRIFSASESGSDNRFDEAISELKDDFDYIISGLDRLNRQGANGTNAALMIAEKFGEDQQAAIDKIASEIE